MSDQIVLNDGASGETYYAVVYDQDGAVWNGSSFQSVATVTWTSVDIFMAEQGSTGQYKGTFPAAIPTGTYTIVVMFQAGGSPSVTEDIAEAEMERAWDGTDLTVPGGGGASGTAVVTTTLTEGYAADGANPTLEQGIFMILANQQAVMDDVTFRAKKLDGVTDAMLYLVDDAQNPTQKIRTS